MCHPPYSDAILACPYVAHSPLFAVQVFMDYRFNPNMAHPDWYTPVDPKEAAKMWAPDKRDSGAKSLFSGSWK